MSKIAIHPFNVVDNTSLPGIMVDKVPGEGDPVEINKEMYFVCEKDYGQEDGIQKIGVIPLVVRNPSKISNIRSYLDCLSIAKRRIEFRKGEETCDLDNCDEMIIS